MFLMLTTPPGGNNSNTWKYAVSIFVSAIAMTVPAVINGTFSSYGFSILKAIYAIPSFFISPSKISGLFGLSVALLFLVLVTTNAPGGPLIPVNPVEPVAPSLPVGPVDPVLIGPVIPV